MRMGINKFHLNNKMRRPTASACSYCRTNAFRWTALCN
jgi:hypothetical protein